MHILKNKTTRVLMQIISALVLISLAISFFYYKNINQSVDPQIVEARKLYEKYNAYAQQNQYDSVFWLMDKVQSIYEKTEHYKESYEIGVLYNNRAASFLTQALFLDYDINRAKKQDSLMLLAEDAVQKSILYYNNWLSVYEDKSIDEVKKMISEDFPKGLEKYSKNQNYKYLQNRVKEIVEAQTETKRRLSVSYTNLGIVYRHQENYEAAAKSYKQAMDLWSKNLTAENNLNLLLGRPIRERSFIEKMFPTSPKKE